MRKYFGELSIGSLQAFAINIAGLFFVFALQYILTQSLSPAQFGSYHYVLSCASVLMIFSLLGFDSSLQRLVPELENTEDKAGLRGLFLSSVVTCLALSVLFASIANFISFLVLPPSHELRESLVVLYGLLPILSIAQLRQSWLRSYKQIYSARFPDIVLRPIFTTVIFILAWMGLAGSLTSEDALVALCAGAGAAFLWGCRDLELTIGKKVRASKARYEVSNWLKLSLSFLLISGATIVLAELDKLLLGVLRTAAEVGIYAVCVQISLLLLFGFDAIGAILAPLISEKNSAGESLQPLIKRSLIGLLLLSAPIAALLFIFPGEVLGIFGADYQAGKNAMLILCSGLTLHLLLGPGGFVLTMSGLEKEALRILLLTLVANCICNLPLIYFFGAEGAAISTAAMFILRAALFRKVAKEKLSVEVSALCLLFPTREQKESSEEITEA